MVDISKFPRGVPGRTAESNIAPFAVWADPNIIANNKHWAYRDESIFLGECDGKPIGVVDDRHMITVAGTRAGKGVSTIIPNLLLYPGSMLVIDPKGENARITAGSRQNGLGQDVYTLDPFNAAGFGLSHGFNPLDFIDITSKDAVDDAALIAEGLVIQDQGSGRHFTMAARNFLRGLVLYVCTNPDPSLRTLLQVRKWLTLDAEGFKLLIKAMQDKDDACGGVIARAANTLSSKPDNERGSVLSTAIEQTDFLDSPALVDCLRSSDFTLADLKRKPTTVYLCLPASRLATHNRWLRIIVNLAVQAMENEKTKPPLPVVFLMDEFAVLDHMESIEKAAGQIAGFDVKLWPIIQDLSQLKSIYKDRWETFMGNAGLLQFFGNNDLTTLQYLSQRLGKSTIMQIAQSEISTGQLAQGFTGKSKSLQATELMTPDEVAKFFSRQSNAQLLLWPGANPIAIDRVRYYDHPWFQGKFVV